MLEIASCPLDFQKAVKTFLEQSENQACTLLLTVFTNVLKDPILAGYRALQRRPSHS